MNCPVCNSRLESYEKHGVEIDVCPGCRGVWLDRGELEKILEAEMRHGAGHSVAYGHGGHGHEDDHEHRKDRGFYGERHEHEAHDGRHGPPGRRRSLLTELFGAFGGDDD